MFHLIKTKSYLKTERKQRKILGEKRFIEMERQLQEDPTYDPGHIKRIVGTENDYRYRIGGFRVFYTVFKEQDEILMKIILPRGEAYKN